MRVLAAIALAVVLVAGCGGDDPLSVDDYKAEAKKICTESRAEQAKIKEPTRATPEAVAAYFRRQLRITERNLDRFDDLEPPENLKDDHDQLLKVSREGVAVVGKLVKALEDGTEPTEALTTVSDDLRRIGAEQKKVADKLGVAECAGE